MLYQEFDIPKYNWRVYAFYDTTADDLDDIMECLHYMRCNASVAKQAYENIAEDKPNTGLTFSKNNQSCIVLSRATSKEQFASTFTHEITHCAIHIANEYGISPQSESLAYIAGDLAAVMLPYASRFICDNCRTKIHNHYER